MSVYQNCELAPTGSGKKPAVGPTRKNPLKGNSYCEGKAALSPRVQKKGDPRAPKFDMWKLTPEARALFGELQKANKKRQEAILNELVKTHEVPKATVQAVIEANKPWYGTTWGAIKAGSWHTVGTDKDGNITHVFKLDGKGLGWENAGHEVDVSVKKQGITYENKGKEFEIGAGYKDRGYADVAHGNKKDGLSEYHGEGGEDGGAASYRHTKGDVSHYGKADVTHEGGTTTGTGTYEHKDGKDSESITAGVSAGNKDGGSGRYKMERKGYGLNIGADGSRTTSDTQTVDQVGGDVTTTHKTTKKDKDGKVVKDKKGQPRAGDPVVVNVTARVKETDKADGAGSTAVTVGGGVKQGGTSARVDYGNTVGNTKDGTAYRVDDIKTKFTKGFELDEKTGSTFSLGLGGNLRLSNKVGEEATYTGDLTGVWKNGKKKDDSREFSFRLHGGHETLGKFGSLGYLHEDMLKAGDKGYGDFGHLGLGYGMGKHELKFDATLGATDATTMFGAHTGYAYGKEHSVDLYASVARQDSDVGTLLEATSKIALGKSLSLTPGGSLILKPTDDGFQEIWAAHMGLGITLKKDMSLTLKMGVAGDGSQIFYVPEAMFEWKDKFSVSAMGNVAGPSAYGVGAKIGIPGVGLTVFGGYGTTGMLTSPYLGNSGMTLPSATDDKFMGQQDTRTGGVIGLSWDALPTLRKIFK